MTTATLHVLHRCPCGAPGHLRTITANGQPIGRAPMCEACVEDVRSLPANPFGVAYEDREGLFYAG